MRAAYISIAHLADFSPRLWHQTPCVQHQSWPGDEARAKIDNDIICNVDHVCVKPDDGTRQIHIKIFYKYTRLEYRQPRQPLASPSGHQLFSAGFNL